MFSKLSIKQKIMGAMLLIGIIPFAFIAYEATDSAKTALTEQAFSKLEAARDIKKAALERYFHTVENQLITTATNNTVISAATDFNQVFRSFEQDTLITEQDRGTQKLAVKDYWQNGFGKEYQTQNSTEFQVSSFAQLSTQATSLQYMYIADNKHPLGSKNQLIKSNDASRYSQFHRLYHPWFDQFSNKFGYYDIFLVNNQGEVVYSVFKELDFATSLTQGPWKNSPLADSFKQAQTLKEGEIHITDLKLYTPSYNAPAGFAATPIMQDGQRVATLIFQLPLANITAIMSDRSGMGETGETYLVGADQLMRSDSYLDPENHSVSASYRNPEKGKVNTEASVAAIQGETGSEIITDYNGNSVLSVYTPVNFGENQWAIMVEIDEVEAFEAIYSLQNLTMITAVIILAIIIGLGWWLASSLSSPIVRLTHKMNEVSQNFDFSQQAAISSKDEVGQAAEAFNTLLSKTSGALSDVNQTMNNIAKGHFNSRIDNELVGDLETLKNNVNASAESVDNTMNALNAIMNAISDGDFKARMNKNIEGEFRTNVDHAMQSMDMAISELGHVIHQLSIGDFSARIQTDLRGDLQTLKNNTNQSVEQLETAMNEIIQAIVTMSHGNLTVTVDGQYQGELNKLKEAYNQSKEQLNRVLEQVNSAAKMVNSASQEVASSSMDLNDRTQNQAASLEETAASMEELTSTIKHNTDNANMADELSTAARQQAQSGQVVMQESIHAITEIEASSQKIEEIIGLIDSIAFQTNLLALNAAVEAARAGEHGRGFAVVAGEVRNLAGKSADAAKDIKGLIESTSRSIKNGSEKIEQTSQSLSEINDSIQKVSNVVSEIAGASHEQKQGVEQINQAISSIDQTTQQNAALVEETSASAQTLSQESDKLNRAVSEFTLDKSTKLVNK
ncbi:MAG: methyl-accepting chemotaxis protein [Pseudomonadota bacterium]|nr:methyl-accepting chemotaxis protein [Pseudomonadota bacterium]